jgi:hypothetical protein
VSDEPDPMDTLAGSVSDGQPVDWSDAESHAVGEDEQLGVAALHEVAKIAEFNRELQRAAPKRAGEGEVSGHALTVEGEGDRPSPLSRLLARIWRALEGK